ncbi:MAG: MoxR family ATPase [Spirochaetales bacterium]
MSEARAWRDKVAAEIGKVFFGDGRAVDWLLTSLLAGGHVLLEDVPGVGKTLLAKAAAQALGGSFARVQGTPDLLPSDLLGFSVYNPHDGSFSFRTGPLENTIILFDEINRASPRTQSALLQAMGEGELSRDGRVVALPDPWLVIATENPVEFEGTFVLPEAQKDRFLMGFSLGYPSREHETALVTGGGYQRRGLEGVAAVSGPDEVRRLRGLLPGVFVDPKVTGYLLDLTEATRQDPSFRLGLSPRGSQAMFQACRALALIRGRDFVLPDDVRELFLPVLGPRMVLKPTAAARGHDVKTLLASLLDRLPTPALRL